MAHAGQKPTKAVKAMVTAVAQASQLTSPVVSPPSTAPAISIAMAMRMMRSQTGRLRFRKNMVDSLFVVDDFYLEAAKPKKDSVVVEICWMECGGGECVP